jgi:type IV fimbrial biogenesis protein FimU
MRDRNKGFSLIELMVTVSVLVILAGVAMPAFFTMIAKNRADSDTGDFYRALNYARLEAINRGVNVQVYPASKSSSGWNTVLNVQVSGAASTAAVLRVIPAMSTNATMTPSSAVSYVEFNNIGTLSYPTAALTMNYTSGSITRTVMLCLNGRVVQNGTC